MRPFALAEGLSISIHNSDVTIKLFTKTTSYFEERRRNEMKKKNVISVVVLVLLVVVLAGIYLIAGKKPEAESGSKNVTIEVVNAAGESTTYELKTDAEYLIQAIDEAEGLEYEGEDGEYGLMISTINGELAEFNTNGAYWGFFVNGEYCNYGVSEQPVADGDAFQIVFTLAE